MTAILIWFGLFFALFTAFAVMRSWPEREAASAQAYVSGDAALPGWIYAPAATAISFSAIPILLLPALVFGFGPQTATLALAAIAIPLTGALFLPRLRALGRARQETDIGGLLAEHYGTMQRPLWVVVALLFAVPFIAVQLRAAGLIVNLLTDDVVSATAATVGLSLIPLAVAAIGGLRAAASAAVACAFLLFVALIVTTGLAFGAIGSISDYGAAAAALAEKSDATAGLAVFAWLVALLGVQASPAFLTLGLASRGSRAFTAQQVWLSSFLFGALLLVALPAIAIAASMLGLDAAFTGAHPDLARPALGAWASGENVQASRGLAAVPIVMRRMALTAPWVVAFLGVCVMSAMLMAAAAEASAMGATFARAIRRDAGALLARAIAGGIVIAAVLTALSSISVFTLAALALGATLQILPSLIALTIAPRLTGAALTTGLVIGLAALLAGLFLLPIGEAVGPAIAGPVALVFNFVAVLAVSAVTANNAPAASHRDLLETEAGEHRWTGRRLAALAGLAAIIALAAFGAPIADAMFGVPDDASAWTLGMPPFIPWMLLLWIAGVALMAMFTQKAR